jgi:hypothetical protein
MARDAFGATPGTPVPTGVGSKSCGLHNDYYWTIREYSGFTAHTNVTPYRPGSGEVNAS